MRSPAHKQSSKRFPLDTILGYTGNVRLLRVLFQLNRPVSKSKLSDLTGLSLPGVHKTADRLLESGIIAYQGSGKQHVVTINRDHPMKKALSYLFAGEEKNWELLISNLKRIVTKSVKSPLSAFIYGSVAEGHDQYGDPLRIAVIDTVKNIDEFTASLKILISEEEIEQRFSVLIEIEGFTKSDISGKDFDKIILLFGLHPSDLSLNYSGSSARRSHEELDLQSKLNTQILVNQLRESPEIIDRALIYLTKKIEASESAINNELREWKQLLEHSSLQQLRQFLMSDSERALRLQQSNPLWMAMNEQDRKRFNELKAGYE